jgi:hypothetical protein
VKTLIVGSGRPDAYADGSAHYDGYVACRTPPELKKWRMAKEFEFGPGYFT